MQISSKNRRILVVSDFHQELDKFKKILAHEKADINVFVGDEYDSHTHDSIYDAEKTARFMSLWVFDPKNVALFGNHTLPYCYINKHTYCSGYSQSKNDLIDEIWGARKWDIVDKYKWYVRIDDFLVSHAGLSPYHIHPRINVKDKNVLTNWLDSQINQAKICLTTGQPHWIFGAGQGRGGNQAFGGLTWLDWEKEFEAIEGLAQIVGHSYGEIVRTKQFQPHSSNPEKYTNYCIDTNLREYLIVGDGKLEIKKFENI